MSFSDVTLIIESVSVFPVGNTTSRSFGFNPEIMLDISVCGPSYQVLRYRNAVGVVVVIIVV
jgi:hypothetical protein